MSVLAFSIVTSGPEAGTIYYLRYCNLDEYRRPGAPRPRQFTWVNFEGSATVFSNDAAGILAAVPPPVEESPVFVIDSEWVSNCLLEETLAAFSAGWNKTGHMSDHLTDAQKATLGTNALRMSLADPNYD